MKLVIHVPILYFASKKKSVIQTHTKLPLIIKHKFIITVR